MNTFARMGLAASKMLSVKQAPHIPTVNDSYLDKAIILRNGQDAVPLRSLMSGGFANRFYGNLDSSYTYDDTTLAINFASALTAWSCIMVSATVLSTLALVVRDDAEHDVPNSPIDDFIKHSRTYMWLTEISLDLWGRSYLRKVRNYYGYPNRLEWLNPLDVHEQVNYNTNEVDYYEVFDTAGTWVNVPPEDIIDIRLFNPIDPLDGISPFEVAMRRIEAERNLIDFGASFFYNSARPDGMLLFQGNLTEEEYSRTKREFQQFKGARNAFKTFIAGATQGSWSWQAMSSPPTDLALRDFNETIVRDICAAFRTNPILVGMGSPSDPLSAISTFREARRNHIEFVSIPRAEIICEELNEQWLVPDFDDLPTAMRIEVDKGAFFATALATPERTSASTQLLSASIMTLDEARSHVGQDAVGENAIQRNPDWALQAYSAGAIKRSMLQKHIGVEVDEKDDGYIYQVDPRELAQLGGGGFGLMPPLEPDPETPGDGSVLLNLANNTAVTHIQKKLKDVYDQAISSIDWIDPDDFHCTIVFFESGDVKSIDIEKMSPVKFLIAEGIGQFEIDDGYALYVRLTLTNELAELQRSVYEATSKMELSEHSDPDSYTPHITLGYSDISLIGEQIDFEQEIRLNVESLQLTAAQSDDEYEVINESKRSFDPALNDLKKWNAKVKNEGHTVTFTSRHLSPEMSGWIREQLDEGWNPQKVFSEARTAVRASKPPSPLGAIPEQYKQYWDKFDTLNVDLAQAWLDYMGSFAGQALSTALNVLGDMKAPGDSLKFLLPDSPSDTLLDTWVGTKDDPGALVALLNAGQAAGEATLVSNKSMRPKRDAVETTTDWSIVSDKAIAYAERYGAKLIKDLNSTTEQLIRDLLARSLREGWARDRFVDAIAEILPVSGAEKARLMSRAKLIAQTESIKAYNNGAFERWRDAGVEEVVWQTVRDAKVCPLCKSLHGKTAKLSEGWRSHLPKYQGKVYTDSAHPGCRCFRRPKSRRS